MADQYYVESGYIDLAYFERIVESDAITLSGAFSPSFTVDIADNTGYYIPDYIAEGYYALPIQEAEAALGAAAALSAQGGYHLETGVQWFGVFSPTLTVNVVRNDSVAADVAFGITVDAVKTVDTSSEFVVITNASSDASKTVGFDSDLSTTASTSATATRIQEAEAVFSGVFAPAMTVSVTRRSEVDLEASVSLAATASPIRNNDAALVDIVNLSLQGDRFRASSSALTLSASLATSAGAILIPNVDPEVPENLSAAFTLESNTSVTKPISLDLDNQFTQNIYGAGIIGQRPLQTKSLYNYILTSSSLGVYSTGYVNYYSSDSLQPGSFDHFILEGFVSSTFSVRQYDVDDSRDSWRFYSEYLSSTDQYRIVFTQRVGPVSYSSLSAVVPSSSWTANSHIAFSMSQNVSSIWLNGTRIANGSTGTPYKLNHVYELRFEQGSYSEFRIIRTDSSTNTLAKYDRETTNTTIAVPTVAFENDDDYQALFHFDGNLADDTTPPNKALLNTTATQTATGGAVFDPTINLTAFNTELVEGYRIQRANASLGATVTVDTSVTRIKPLDVDLTANASVDTALSRIVAYTADLTCSSSQSTTVTRIQPGVVALTSQGAQLTAAGYIGEFVADLATSSSLTADTSRIKQFNVDITGAYNATLTANAIRTLETVLDTTATLETTPSKTVGYSADFAASTTQTVSYGKIVQLDAVLPGAFAPTITAVVERDATVNLSASFGFDATTLIIEGLGAVISTSSTLTSTPKRVRSTASTMQSSTTLRADTTNYTMFVYVVPQEIREFSIDAETKEYAILAEDREYILE